MPITQDRMMRLAQAARTYADLYEALCGDIRSAMDKAMAGLDTRVLLGELYTRITTQPIDPSHMATLQGEEKHALLTRARNKASREYMRRQRAQGQIVRQVNIEALGLTDSRLHKAPGPVPVVPIPVVPVELSPSGLHAHGRHKGDGEIVEWSADGQGEGSEGDI